MKQLVKKMTLAEVDKYILLAHGCITNPDFYKQLGHNIENAIQDGIKEIEEKYSIGIK